METKKKEMTYVIKPESGIDISDTTATPSDVLAGKDFYGASGVKTSGLIQTYAGAVAVTPTEQAQTVGTGGKYVASDITVAAIPSEYKDTTGTDAVSGDILAGKKAVTGSGLVTGSVQTYSGASTVTQNGTLPTAGKYVENDIEVSVPAPSPVLVTKNITANGTYAASSDNADGYSSVTVNVAAVSKLPQVVDKSVTSIDAADLQGATKIGDYSFRDCLNLVSLNLPNTIVSIGNYAFYNNQQLGGNIVIPDSVQTIGNQAFRITSVREITIGRGVVSIGSWCFAGNSYLQKYIILANTPPTLADSNTFQVGVPKYIPNGTLTAYQTATNWSAYANDYIELPA